MSLQFGLVFGGWILILGVVMALFSFSGQPGGKHRSRVMSHGYNADATVTRVTADHHLSINGINPVIVSYSYLANGRRRVSSMETLSVELANTLRPGDPLAIRVLGDDSTVPQMEPASLDFLWVPLLIFPVIGLFFIGFAVLGARKKCRLLASGVQSTAELIGMAPLSWWGWGRSFFNRPRFEISYFFSADDLSRQYGQSITKDLNLINEKRRGDKIDILVMPGRSSQSMVIDFGAERILAESARRGA